VCAQIATSKIRFIWFPASIREVTTKPKQFRNAQKAAQRGALSQYRRVRSAADLTKPNRPK
jgi:hypothetical protein